MKLLILVAVAVPLCCAPRQFRSEHWTVIFDAADWSASAVLTDGRRMIISAPQRPQVGIIANTELKDNSFTVKFVTDQPGKLTWPVAGAPDEGISYIIPRGEFAAGPA